MFYLAKERTWNNLNNYGSGFLFLTKQFQEAHSCSTQRLRWFGQEQKDRPECSSYFMHVPNVIHIVVGALLFLASGIAASAIITLTPLTPTNISPGLDIQFNLSADFESDTTDGGAVDIAFDPNVLQFKGFQFDPGFTIRDSFFDIEDLQSSGLLSIGFGSFSNTFSGVFDIGILTLTANGAGNTQITLGNSIKWGGFGVPVDYTGASVQVVQAVPIPASGWLLFSALAFLTRFSRQKS